MTFPLFRYHPDPIASGSVMGSQTECLCCEQKRGFIYTGPVYSEDTLERKICPWCIANGQAAEKFEAVFTDQTGIGGDELAIETQEKVARRTPGFTARQQERWLSCCNDAAAFLGPMGYEELKKLGPEVAAAVKEYTRLEDGEWVGYFRLLKRDEAPTAFIFQCLHCSAIKAYTDRV